MYMYIYKFKPVCDDNISSHTVINKAYIKCLHLKHSSFSINLYRELQIAHGVDTGGGGSGGARYNPL